MVANRRYPETGPPRPGVKPGENPPTGSQKSSGGYSPTAEPEKPEFPSEIRRGDFTIRGIGDVDTLGIDIECLPFIVADVRGGCRICGKNPVVDVAFHVSGGRRRPA